MKLKGIDVSEHQGTIDWSKVKSHIDFAIIRAGYGKNNIDRFAKLNVMRCAGLGIPFGIYWFSYAYTEDMAIKEADYCIDFVQTCYKEISAFPTYPICFDFEYDSYNYALKKGVKLSSEQCVNIAKAFLNRVEERGFYAMNYSNLDYLNNHGFSSLLEKYDLWYARWGLSTPDKNCGIWQDSSTGFIDGISGKVDTDIAYKDYPTIINKLSEEKGTKKSSQKSEAEIEKWMKERIAVAYDVIAGKYGNGTARINNLSDIGENPDFIQHIVNTILGY